MTALFSGGVLASGVGLGMASMLSVGPNNLMLLREGLARGRTMTVATTVWFSYFLLLLSAMTLSSLPQVVGPSVRLWLSWCGFATLSWFAIMAFKAGLSSRALGGYQRSEARTSLMRVLAIVWCNPLTYLELFLVPAAYCQTLVTRNQRVEFIAAIVMMHAVTCYGYALVGRACGRLVDDRRTVRVFDVISGLLLAGSAIVLALASTVGDPTAPKF